ncbi:myoneurin-like [Trichogramma pretiosum]|uniref:myoneurin-like n=1 Tax=Trichogramma pretiosum TaxID=7493 RepID=UPI0006C9E022|nr:myoneurin-like [Trichogramma pretiosum]
MEPSSVSTRALRIKKDPLRVLTENNDLNIIINTRDIKNSVRPLRKYNENHDDLRIKSNKSKDVKLNGDVLTLTKVEDHSKNHCENIKCSDDRENQNPNKVKTAESVKRDIFSDKAKSSITIFDSILGKENRQDVKCSDDRENKKVIKAESAGAAKKEISSDEAKGSIAKIDCELHQKNRQDEKCSHDSEISRELDEKMNIFSPNLDASRKAPREKETVEVRIGTASDKIITQCNLCGKIFNKPSGLCRHFKSSHKGRSYACEKCDKIFGKRGTLKAHVDVAHPSRI